MTQPLPNNLHPSQCYRLLDPKRDTLQDGDELQFFRFGQTQWEPVDKIRFGEKPLVNHTYRRPFTPPAPVQVREFWRLLEIGEDRRTGDQFQQYGNRDWVDVTNSLVGTIITERHSPHRRRVTVPVAAPAPVADAGPVELLKSFADQEASRIVKAFAHAPKAESITESGPYLVSVDGHEAPTMEHATLEDARAEAERLARREHPAQVRLLRQVAVARAEVTVKWEESK